MNFFSCFHRKIIANLIKISAILLLIPLGSIILFSSISLDRSSDAFALSNLSTQQHVDSPPSHGLVDSLIDYGDKFVDSVFISGVHGIPILDNIIDIINENLDHVTKSGNIKGSNNNVSRTYV
ncbi:MAG: hypothetical protein KGH81_06455 [Thaumarchaeota archaeon]|nr:hypothetical protein [Nitrososphaerota archaeon]MDE1841413.1 hypothetical protein [Nitrososphaerota archaeon]